MKFTYVVIASLLMAALALSGCTSPAPTASPSPSATAPTATQAATPTPTATPSPAPTVAPSPSPMPAYSNGSPVSISNIKIDWDTTQYEGQAKETVTMKVKNTLTDSVVLDVVVIYKVTMPATFANPDGSLENRTNTLTATPQNIGLMQVGEQRDVTLHIDHNKNVPVTVSVTVQWRGGSAVVFEKTLNIPDHSFGTYEF